MIFHMHKSAWRLLIGCSLIAVLVSHAAGWVNLPLLTRTEFFLHDVRIRALAPGTPDDRIVIVDIDEKSLREKERGGEGHWPWPRDRLAELVSTLFVTYSASVVAMDIILSERDRSSGLDVLERLAREELRDVPMFAEKLNHLRPSLSFDQTLATAMQKGPVVLGYAFHNDTPSLGTDLPEGFDSSIWGLTNLTAHSYSGYTGLLPELKASSVAAGHLNPLRDADGLVRRVPLLVEYQGRFYPSLALTVVQQVIGEPRLGMNSGRYGEADVRVESLRIGPLEVPVDGALNAIVPFRGVARSFSYVSAVDVMQGNIEPSRLKDRIVIIGTSAAGLSDLVSTPVGVSMPGVEVHANLITAMFDDRVPFAPAWSKAFDVLSILVLGAIALSFGRKGRPAHTVIFFCLVFLVVTSLNFLLLKYWQLLLPLSTPLAALGLLFVFDMIYGFFVESRGKRQMSALFAQYVPPELVDQMALDPSAYSMEPVERELTVLFADIRNFTAISERLSPQALGKLMNRVLGAETDVIRNDYQGTLDKYIGDAVMAFWGAPVSNPQHSSQAVLAAQAMLKAVRSVDEEGQTLGWPKVQIGIGINTGLMYVGDMGSTERQAYTVLGDAVNLASRLEGLTKFYGVDILMGESTRAALHDWVCREVDRVQVKGKTLPVTIYEPIGRNADVPDLLKFELDRWEHALLAYRSRDWSGALQVLEALQESYPKCKLYALYAQRVSQYNLRPPSADWDGSISAIV
jgi:adenylate cyclase